MTAEQIDYMSVFRNLPTPIMVLSTDFMIMDATSLIADYPAKRAKKLSGSPYSRCSPTTRPNPGPRHGQPQRVAPPGGRDRPPDTMALQRYDVEIKKSGLIRGTLPAPDELPVHRPDGGTSDYIIHIVEEVPELIRKFVDAESAGSANSPPLNAGFSTCSCWLRAWSRWSVLVRSAPILPLLVTKRDRRARSVNGRSTALAFCLYGHLSRISATYHGILDTKMTGTRI